MKRLIRGWTGRIIILLVALGTLVFTAFLILDQVYPFPEHALRPAPAKIVLDRNGDPLRMFLAPDQSWRFPVTLDEVSPTLVKALIASEDRYFGSHPGVNPVSILRAAMTNIRAGQTVCGGSTIPMQVARLAEPKPRTFKSKIIEAFRALQLAWHHNENEVLELYLNMTPYGSNFVGVGAAARFYFGKTPDHLSLGESALLTILPRSPSRYDPIRNPETAKATRDATLKRFEKEGIFSTEEVREALREPMPDSLVRPPLFAPHFSQSAIQAMGSRPRIYSGIDPRIQSMAQDILRGRADWLREQGIESAAAVVLDTRTREVLAMIGSPDFFDDAHGGQINGAMIRRSPGSTLKPFLYAMAFDMGETHPAGLLMDIPTDYSGYSPDNYDGTFQGAVTTEYALVHSLNVPAVRLLGRCGLGDFHALLKRGGLSSLDQPAGYYGLPLVLGGCEVTLLELTNLYATLASGGEYRPVRFLAQKSIIPGLPIFSRESSHLVTQILTKLERPDMAESWRLTQDVPTVAWKTGTSFGHRDAWAIGYSGEHTIGIWVGNLDGQARKGISGARHAGPLMFDLFRAVEPGASSPPEFTRLELDEIELSAVSRKLPGPFCEDRINAVIIPGKTRLETDNWTRRIFVDDETGFRVSGDCLMTRPHHAEVVTIYPVELATWKMSQGHPIDVIPPMDPACGGIPAEGAPHIISPNPGTPYRIRSDAPSRFQRIPLEANTAPDAAQLYWYQDGTLVSQGTPKEQLFLEPVPGEHRLVVQDNFGRSDSIKFKVE